MLRNYDFITAETLGYFTPRLDQAPEDAEFALTYVKENARTIEQQEAVQAVLRAKCDILWAMLDALHLAYVAPRMVAPGAFVPDEG
jgi:pyrroloquinoline-quinone synthase